MDSSRDNTLRSTSTEGIGDGDISGRSRVVITSVRGSRDTGAERGSLGDDRRAGIRGRGGDDGGRSRSRRRSNRGRTSGYGGAGGQDWGWIDKHRRGGHSRVDVPGMEELVVAGMAGLRTSSQSGQQSDGDLVVEMHLVDIVR